MSDDFDSWEPFWVNEDEEDNTECQCFDCRRKRMQREYNLEVDWE